MCDGNCLVWIKEFSNIDGVLDYRGDPTPITTSRAQSISGIPGTHDNDVPIVCDSNSFLHTITAHDMHTKLCIFLYERGITMAMVPL